MEVKVGLTGNEIEELFIEIRGFRKGKKLSDWRKKPYEQAQSERFVINRRRRIRRNILTRKEISLT